MPRLFYLIYESIETRKLPISALEDLAAAARKKNFKLDVTGLLIRKKQGFIQYLEGNKTTVTLLYEEILRDKRHHSLVVLAKGHIRQRKFASWSLLLKFVTNDEIHTIESIRSNTFKRRKNKKASNLNILDTISELQRDYKNYN